MLGSNTGLGLPIRVPGQGVVAAKVCTYHELELQQEKVITQSWCFIFTETDTVCVTRRL